MAHGVPSKSFGGPAWVHTWPCLSSENGCGNRPLPFGLGGDMSDPGEECGFRLAFGRLFHKHSPKRV